MKLNSILYNVTGTEVTEKGVNYLIRLNPDSIIYKAHFPEQPVTPGVCIIEIAHELMEEHLQCALDVKTVKSVKFVSVLSPLEVQDVVYEISNIKDDEDGNIKFQATAKAGDTVYAKISMTVNRS